MSLEVPVKVFRYKPGDGAPRYQAYRVTVPDEANVIDVIEAVWRQDTTFAFRHACHHASCGTCGVRLNGYERLPCIYPVTEALKGRREILIEPLRNFPIVSDLVVDIAAFFQKQEASHLVITRQAEAALDGVFYTRSEVFDDEGRLAERPYNRFENCIECGLCLSACPTMAASDKFFGPAGLAAIDRARQEAPDPQQRSFLLALADGEQGVWRCHSAFECASACPQNVDPAGAIMALRRDLVTHKIKKFFGTG
ncbi:MAG: 2Fe-2S iron-sulfur cluster-binding protein [Chloroflexota bacterium]